jgi:hypothetical protein
MLLTTSKLWHHNLVQKINFIVLFTTQVYIKIVKLKEYLKMKKDVEDRVRSQFECIFLPFKEKIMFKSQLIKSNHRVLWKNKTDTYGAPVMHLIIAPMF